MLDGFVQVNEPDLKDSEALLKKWAYKFSKKTDALDMGAGIGRISKEILLHNFKNVDILE